MVYSSLVSSSKLELVCLDNTFHEIVIYVEAWVFRRLKSFLEDSSIVFVTLIYKITEADNLQKIGKLSGLSPSCDKSQLDQTHLVG